MFVTLTESETNKSLLINPDAVDYLEPREKGGTRILLRSGMRLSVKECMTDVDKWLTDAKRNP